MESHEWPFKSSPHTEHSVFKIPWCRMSHKVSFVFMLLPVLLLLLLLLLVLLLLLLLPVLLLLPMLLLLLLRVLLLLCSSMWVCTGELVHSCLLIVRDD